jgi:hypothetical protein
VFWIDAGYAISIGTLFLGGKEHRGERERETYERLFEWWSNALDHPVVEPASPFAQSLLTAPK